ncbi:MAG: cell division FtsA domain-containing protein [Bacillota bacterium]|nr:cell division FtsA domain-containing protein [Bacillota bacterium]
MEERKYTGQLVFGLDIGTRSIVGTVGYKRGDQFIVVAQRTKEHETRAMLDGQIHDIMKVGETIRDVKAQLEKATGRKLSEVCIAAAGRVLRTVTTHVEYPFTGDKEVSQEDIYGLIAAGVEKAYQEFLEEQQEEDLKFYCVGHSVVRYYLNGYPMGNLEGHKARTIGIDLIATFLPDDVVDGLYKAVEIAGLTVSSLTLEPIAAIMLAIPERFRMLNIALLDVGAGTSDISITNDGCILAYGMIPMAGDLLTEEIAKHCLVDFAAAEQIKRDAGEMETISYTDIMLLPQTISSEEVKRVTAHVIEDMAEQAADKIKELNGGKPVSAVFVVGGGGKIPGYTEAVADKLGIARERVALRGEEVMQQIIFEEDVKKDSLLVTPIGICLNFYEQSNNFIFISFNDKRVKMYDNNRLTVADAAMQVQFPNDGLFPRRGKALEFTVNGKQRMARGQLGEAAVITINGQAADIYTPIHANDIIKVIQSTAGEPGKMTVGELPEMTESLSVYVNDKRVEVPRFANVNKVLQSGYYEICEGDQVEILNYYTVEQIVEFMDVVLEPSMKLYVNNKLADKDTPVYENFSVVWTEGEMAEYAGEAEGTDSFDEAEEETEETVETAMQPVDGKQEEVPRTISVIVNKQPIALTGKSRYVYVDVFECIDFDLSRPRGKGIVTTLNGRPAEYMEPINDGDVIEIYWRS